MLGRAFFKNGCPVSYWINLAKLQAGRAQNKFSQRSTQSVAAFALPEHKDSVRETQPLKNLDPFLDGELPQRVQPQKLFSSVVKIFCDHTDPNFCQPWQMRRQGSSTGSGFVIEGQRIMTNAHCVSFQNRVLVRKPGDARRFPAVVEAIAHECDLALLRIEDEQFWKSLPALKFGDLPDLHDSVVVVGYPTGGDNLSITAGVVSRLDVTTYAHSNFKLLCAQIDAAINPGNSGGPAFRLQDGTVAGVAFQGYGDAQNIGYIVPTCVIKHFLKDVENNKQYTGFVTLGVTYQTLENPAMRRFYGLDEIQDKGLLPEGITQGGILIVQTDELRNRQSGQNPKKSRAALHINADEGSESLKLEEPGLKKNDILMAIDGVNIADDGTVHFRGMERVHLSHVTANFFAGESVEAIVLRDKCLRRVTVPLHPPQYLVPEHQWDKTPRYFIFGGLVFCPLTLDYLKDEFGKKYYERAPTPLMTPLSEFFPKKENQEVVVLSQILASELTIGYDLKNARLQKVNGVPIENLHHLVQVLVDSKEKQFVDFEFDHEVRVILDFLATRNKTPDILSQHEIPRPWSSDLNEVASSLISPTSLNSIESLNKDSNEAENH